MARAGLIGLALAACLGGGSVALGQPAAQPDPMPPPRPAAERADATEASLSRDELRALLEAATATAKASRENVDYARVVPDILSQILAKLDKIEDKLDKVETAIKAQGAPARRR